MPSPATAGRWSRAAPKVIYGSRAEAPGQLRWESRSEWVRDLIDVLIGGVLLAFALIALL